MIVVKDDDLHVVSAFRSAYSSGGYGFHKVCASYSLSTSLATPRVIGQSIRVALKQLYIVPRKEDEPKRDALDELGYVDGGKFLKGIREIMIRHISNSSILRFVGAYSFTQRGFDNVDNCEAKLAGDANDEAVGQGVVDMLKKIQKKVAK